MNRASSTYGNFEGMLLQYINIVAPIIRSLWSLEAAHANASDVFIFWLAAAATLKDLFSKGSEKTGITDLLAREVMGIFNKRYKEFFANKIYFVAFTLDPREFHVMISTSFSAHIAAGPSAPLGYPHSEYLKKSTPGLGVIVIPPQVQKNSLNIASNAERMPYANAHKRVKEFLKVLLRPEVDRHETHPIPALMQLTTAQIVDGLRHQIDAYWRGEWPFDQKVENNDPLAWWTSLCHHPHARVLAVCDLF